MLQDPRRRALRGHRRTGRAVAAGDLATPSAGELAGWAEDEPVLPSGKGSPTVVLDAGFGSGASPQAQDPPTLAETTQVCAYDRAGQRVQRPRAPCPATTGAIVADERAMLKTAGIKGPFVLVGHSMAGAARAALRLEVSEE